MKRKILEAFFATFGTPPSFLVRSPGRVNLIGEHTDYNDGFVLPMAIDRAVWIALRPRPDGQVFVHSLDFDQAGQFDLSSFRHAGEGWLEYIKGTAWALQEAGYSLAGWEGVFAGDIPIGAGLSSSAALELATARAFTAISDLAWEPAPMALLGQKAENEWVGLNCGIMDQMISASGQAGHAMLIDCRSLETTAVPLPPESTVVVMDTATRRGLVDSAYNERRAQCEAAAAFFQVPALRDVSLSRFERRADELDPLIRQRARHVISENERTLQAVTAMQQGDAHRLGRLMAASHASLRDDFEVSSRELNIMVKIAQKQHGCHGARMTGAGFGGCAVALVRTSLVEAFADRVHQAYETAAGLMPSIYICQASEGSSLVT
ncbi:MAG: galactokinase [Chloroflexota bacterium]